MGLGLGLCWLVLAFLSSWVSIYGGWAKTPFYKRIEKQDLSLPPDDPHGKEFFKLKLNPYGEYAPHLAAFICIYMLMVQMRLRITVILIPWTSNPGTKKRRLVE